jgi:hypothetical protein
MLRQINEINRFVEFGAGLNFLYGFGGHIGFFYSDNYRPFGLSRIYYPGRRFSPVLGVDAYTGLEYRMESIPIVFGIDYKPFFEFSLYQYFKLQLWDFAFSARYRF